AGQASDGYQSHTTFGPDPVSATLDNATVSTTITVDELPAITSANTVHFDAATAGSFTVTSVGYPTPALSEAGALPAGLTFTDNGNGTATLAGTPTGAGGSFPVTVTANNGVNPNATQTLTITVGQPSTPPTVTGSPTPATAGQPYSFAFSTSGTPAPTVTVSAGSLPPGLSLSSSGVLSGTPSTAGSFDLTVQASNGTPPDALNPVTLVVNATVPDPPTAVQAVAGDRSATVSWTAPVFTGGAPITSYTVLGTDTSTSATFSQQVTGSPAPTTATVTGLTGGDSYQFTIVATNIAGNSTASASSGSVTALSPPVIDGTPPAGTVGLSYSYPFSTAGYPAPAVAVTAGSLPPGLSLSSGGLLSGTPTTAGNFSFTVTATNGVDPAASRPVSVSITPAGAATITATSGMNQAGTAGQPFAQRLVATVLDSMGNPVAGATVTFTVTSGSATFAGGTKAATAISDGSGQASAPVLTAGKTAGPVTVTATSGSASPATFSETVLSVSSARADLVVSLSAPASTPRSGTFTVTVKVKNNGPNSASTLLATLGLGSGLTVVSAPGGTTFGGTVIYTAAGLASNATLTYTVQVKAGRNAANTSLFAGALSIAPDPVLSNNLAVARLRIS
ncbi:MAG: putative Ig domain-containing protein, partial [Jatrophihabitantaceae bacterium]